MVVQHGFETQDIDHRIRRVELAHGHFGPINGYTYPIIPPPTPLLARPVYTQPPVNLVNTAAANAAAVQSAAMSHASDLDRLGRPPLRNQLITGTRQLDIPFATVH